jgi:hypothetical protein
MLWSELKPLALLWGETYQLTVEGGVIQGIYTGDYTMWQAPFVARQFLNVRTVRGDASALVNRFGVVHLCNYENVGFPCYPAAVDPIVKNPETGENCLLLEAPLSSEKARMQQERSRRDCVQAVLKQGARQPNSTLFLLPDELIEQWLEPFLFRPVVGPLPE